MPWKCMSVLEAVESSSREMVAMVYGTLVGTGWALDASMC